MAALPSQAPTSADPGTSTIGGPDLAASVLESSTVVVGPAPYLANIEPVGRAISRFEVILFNLVDPSRPSVTRDLADVNVAVFHGGAWEQVMFRGQFLPPYLASVAIQAPQGRTSALHFQIRRTGGWKSGPSLRVSAWGYEAT